MRNVLIDTNVILDFAFKREPFFEHAKTLFSEIAKGNVMGFITASMATDIYYLLQKTTNKSVASEIFSELLIILDVLPVDRNDVYAALHSGLNDFEDALQVQVAVKNGMDAIITRNSKDFQNVHSTDIVLPHNFVAYLNKTT